MITRQANAVWNGNLKQGDGSMRFGSVESNFTFASRFESGDGTNPEELIGAAHAGCFSMAFANTLDQAGHTARSVRTTARVHLDTNEKRVSKIDLQTEADVPGISEDEFQRIAKDVSQNCPISKTLVPCVEVTVDAKLVS
jgi:lipoyl-dependent peroxiredoxin